MIRDFLGWSSFSLISMRRHTFVFYLISITHFHRRKDFFETLEQHQLTNFYVDVTSTYYFSESL